MQLTPPPSLQQIACLLARFFGFYLLFFGVVNLTEFPPYWLRSNFSRPYLPIHTSHDPSYDVSLIMYCIRVAAELTFGGFFFRRPHKLAGLFLEYFEVQPPPQHAQIDVIPR